jgi:hypothetical protein
LAEGAAVVAFPGDRVAGGVAVARAPWSGATDGVPIGAAVRSPIDAQRFQRVRSTHDCH